MTSPSSADPADSRDILPAPSSPSLPSHAWSLQYIGLRSFALILRTLTSGLMALLALYESPPKDVHIVKTTVPLRGGRQNSVHIYTPKDAAKGVKLPVYLNFHGSGFLIPSLGSDIEFCQLMAKQLHCAVIDCDYRKAPEHPAPAQVQDAEDCISWALSQGEQYDLSRVSIGGFSAGANLALCASSLYGHRLTACVAFYPPTDFQRSPDRKAHSAPDVHRSALPPWLSKVFDRSYLVAGADRADPLVSPITQDVDKFPPYVWITCATGDTLYHDGEEMIDKLQKGGHPHARFHKIFSEGHAFDKLTREGTETSQKKAEAYRLALQTVEESWKAVATRGDGAKL